MTGRVCSIDGCELKHRARGWCSHHYEVWRWTTDHHGRRQHSSESVSAHRARRLLADLATRPDVTVVTTEAELRQALGEGRVFVFGVGR